MNEPNDGATPEKKIEYDCAAGYHAKPGLRVWKNGEMTLDVQCQRCGVIYNDSPKEQK